MSSSSSPPKPDASSSPDLPPLATPLAAAAAAAAAASGSAGVVVGISLGGGAGSSGRRLPPPCWTHEETLALIEAYRDKWESLRKGNLRAADWDAVAEEVTARCGRFPTATPKSGVQCRHKIEKLRKRYRAERMRSMGRPKGPKWPFFPLLHDLAGGGLDPNANTSTNPVVKIKSKGGATAASPSPATSPSSDGVVRSRSLHGLMSNGGAGSGLRFTIPRASRTKVALRQPRMLEDEEGDAMTEVSLALRALGEGYLRMEERKMEMALQMERARMDMEIKRTEMLLESQQLLVEAFLSKPKKAKTSSPMEED